LIIRPWQLRFASTGWPGTDWRWRKSFWRSWYRTMRRHFERWRELVWRARWERNGRAAKIFPGLRRAWTWYYRL